MLPVAQVRGERVLLRSGLNALVCGTFAGQRRDRAELLHHVFWRRQVVRVL